MVSLETNYVSCETTRYVTCEQQVVKIGGDREVREFGERNAAQPDPRTSTDIVNKKSSLLFLSTCEGLLGTGTFAQLTKVISVVFMNMRRITEYRHFRTVSKSHLCCFYKHAKDYWVQALSHS